MYDAAKCQRNEAEHETAGDADISTSVAIPWPLGDEVKGSDNVWSYTSSYVFGKSRCHGCDDCSNVYS